jgi:hypothetical protein
MNVIEDKLEQMRRELSTETLAVARYPELHHANIPSSRRVEVSTLSL